MNWIGDIVLLILILTALLTLGMLIEIGIERAAGKYRTRKPYYGPIVHACPTGDSGITPCCRLSPMELPHHDRITLDMRIVTCAGRTQFTR